MKFAGLWPSSSNEIRLLENLAVDGHLFKEQRGICLSPKRGLFLGREELFLFIPRFVEGVMERGFSSRGSNHQDFKAACFSGLKFPGRKKNLCEKFSEAREGGELFPLRDFFYMFTSEVAK